MFFLLVSIFSLAQPRISLRFSYTYSDEPDYKVGWFETNVDHFGFSNDDKFSIRYVYLQKLWKPTGPVFFYSGNEGDIFGFVRNTGFLWEIGERFGATVIFAEHRYYGRSIPYNGQKNNSFTYLTVEQAMYDYVDLISKMFPHRPVIAFGGSYGGMLAAWLRMKYPAYILGSVASSAPIMLFRGMSDCSGPYDVITKSFRLEDKNSVKNIRRLFDLLKSHEGDADYTKALWNKLDLCPKMSENIDEIIEGLSDVLFNVAMVNYATPSTLIVPLPAHPVKIIASFFSKSEMSDDELTNGLLQTLEMYFKGVNLPNKCFDFDLMYGSLGMDPWNYQACAEIVLDVCSRRGPNNMFPDMSSPSSSTCPADRPVKSRPTQLPTMMNVEDMSSFSRIIFPNGDLDPWSAGGYTKTSNPNLTVITIRGGAHHSDLRSSTPNDSPSLVAARKEISDIIMGWLS